MHWSFVQDFVRAGSRRLVALGAAITVAFCAVFALGLWDTRNRDREQTLVSAENVIASMSSEIERNLELYGLSLDAVADGLTLPELASVSPELRQRILFDRAATAKDIGSIFVLDRQGTLTHDSRIVAPMPEDHASRDYFAVHAANPQAGLYVSVPWRAIDGHYIAISRAVTDAGGAFAGVVAGTLKLSYVETMFRELKLGARDTVALIREDGTMIMRAPAMHNVIGRSVANSSVFVRIASRPSGSFEDFGSLDNVERLYVFRRVAEYPLILSYNRATADIYAGWWSKAWQFGTLVLALCAINILLMTVLTRALRQRAEAENRMAAMAATDGLTGLSNRRALDEAFGREWRRAMRERTPVALLMIDADGFKAFNDAFGHQAGDTALAAIADCLRQSARRATEVCARYGGEEFAVLLPGLSSEEARGRAEAIRAHLHALRAAQQGRPDSTPTVSIGVAALLPRPGLEPRDLVRAADAALYEAKAGGRDRVVTAPLMATARALASSTQAA